MIFYYRHEKTYKKCTLLSKQNSAYIANYSFVPSDNSDNTLRLFFSHLPSPVLKGLVNINETKLVLTTLLNISSLKLKIFSVLQFNVEVKEAVQGLLNKSVYTEPQNIQLSANFPVEKKPSIDENEEKELISQKLSKWKRFFPVKFFEIKTSHNCFITSCQMYSLSIPMEVGGFWKKIVELKCEGFLICRSGDRPTQLYQQVYKTEMSPLQLKARC